MARPDRVAATSVTSASWSRRWESNPRPDDYKSSALPTAPHRRGTGIRPAPTPSYDRFPGCRGVRPVAATEIPDRGPRTETLASAPAGRQAGGQWPTLLNTSDGPSGGSGGRGKGTPVIRALLVLVLFVVVHRGRYSATSTRRHDTTKPSPDRRQGPTTTSTTVRHSTHPTTTTTTGPEQGAGAGGQCRREISGAAAAVSAQLRPGGWALLPPTNASAQGHRVPRVLPGRLQPRSRRHRLGNCSSRAPRCSRTRLRRRSVLSGRRMWSWSSGRTWPTRRRPPPLDRRSHGGSGPATGRRPSSEVRRALAPLLVDPANSAIISDFDGTLSPIVADPGDGGPAAGDGRSAGVVGPTVRCRGRRVGAPGFLSGRTVGRGRPSGDGWRDRVGQRRPGPPPSACTASSRRTRTAPSFALRKPSSGVRRWTGRSSGCGPTPLPASRSSPRAWPSPSTGAELLRLRHGRPELPPLKRREPESVPTPAGCRSSSARRWTSTRDRSPAPWSGAFSCAATW